MSKKNGSEVLPSIPVPARPKATKAKPESARGDETLVPLLNRGGAIDLATDPSLGKPKAQRIHRGVNYVRRGDLFKLGEMVRVGLEGENGEDLSYDEWRAYPTCPAGRSCRVEILDLCSMAPDSALVVVRTSTSIEGLQHWAKAETRSAVVSAITQKVAGLKAQQKTN